MRQWVRSHLTYANVMVTILAFIVLTGGTAVALSGSNTVFSDDITDNQVYSADVRNDTLAGGGLAAADLKPSSIGTSEVTNDSLTGADTALGYSRPQASVPPTGEDTTSPKELTVDCPAGSKVTGGGYVIFPDSSKITAVRSYPLDADTWLVRAVADPSVGVGWHLTVVANCLNG